MTSGRRHLLGGDPRRVRGAPLARRGCGGRRLDVRRGPCDSGRAARARRSRARPLPGREGDGGRGALGGRGGTKRPRSCGLGADTRGGVRRAGRALLFQDGVDREPFRCPRCGRVAVSGETCPFDGTSMEASDQRSRSRRPPDPRPRRRASGPCETGRISARSRESARFFGTSPSLGCIERARKLLHGLRLGRLDLAVGGPLELRLEPPEALLGLGVLRLGPPDVGANELEVVLEA